MWEPDLAIHTNLQQLLEVNLPLKDSQQAESYDVTCCICYSDRLNGEVPSRTCDNSKCGQSFHIFCLYEVFKVLHYLCTCSVIDIILSLQWLRSLIQSRKLGNKVFGACPYCETVR